MNLKIKRPKEIMKYFKISITIYISLKVINGIILLDKFGKDPYYEIESMRYSGSTAFYLIKGLINFIAILYFIFGSYHALNLILVVQDKLIKDNSNSEEEINE